MNYYMNTRAAPPIEIQAEPGVVRMAFYGTLRPGEHNYPVLQRILPLDATGARGTLRGNVSTIGWLPRFTPASSLPVSIEPTDCDAWVIECKVSPEAQRMVASLDIFESMYDRVLTAVTVGGRALPTWVYDGRVAW